VKPWARGFDGRSAWRYGADVKVVADQEAARFVREHGGTLWVWLDPHRGIAGQGFIYLAAATELPGTSRATRRMRSARRPHRFRSFEADGFDVRLDPGRLQPPAELHLELKRFPKRRVDAFWNGAIFVGEDIPPPSEW
jgi:hypothetical protein